jgi:enoyl-CoA hydratase/carnithine racemase
MIRTAAAADGVRTITIDRPARRNALAPADLTALEAAVAEAEEAVLYLHGAGEVFCAGADLEAVADLDGDTGQAFAAHGQRVARELASYDGAVVAGIDGAARGGGVELALACDVRVATPDATLAEPGVSLGLFGAWGGTVRLPEVVGLGQALDLGLSGRVVDAGEAREMGLVSRVTDVPRAVAADIAGNDAAAVRVVKSRTRDDAPQADQEAAEARAFADLLAGGAANRPNRNG